MATAVLVELVQWKAQLLEGAMDVFLTRAETRESQSPSVKDVQAKIGQLALENDSSPPRLVAWATGQIACLDVECSEHANVAVQGL
jgi:hypothetical protein